MIKRHEAAIKKKPDVELKLPLLHEDFVGKTADIYLRGSFRGKFIKYQPAKNFTLMICEMTFRLYLIPCDIFVIFNNGSNPKWPTT